MHGVDVMDYMKLKLLVSNDSDARAAQPAQASASTQGMNAELIRLTSFKCIADARCASF
jgi:hypothetical protein